MQGFHGQHWVRGILSHDGITPACHVAQMREGRDISARRGPALLVLVGRLASPLYANVVEAPLPRKRNGQRNPRAHNMAQQRREEAAMVEVCMYMSPCCRMLFPINPKKATCNLSQRERFGSDAVARALAMANGRQKPGGCVDRDSPRARAQVATTGAVGLSRNPRI